MPGSNKSITQLTELTAPLGTDVLPIVDVAGDGSTKKIKYSNLVSSGATGPTGAVQFNNNGSLDGIEDFVVDTVNGGVVLGRVSDGNPFTIATPDNSIALRLQVGAFIGAEAVDTPTGGEVLITAGSAVTDGDGGEIEIIAGDGGSSSGDGGPISITAGNASQGSGGEIDITTGNGGYGDGGDINLTTGDAEAGSGGQGGVISLFGGRGNGSNRGGVISIVGGNGGNSGNGGTVSLYGGNSGPTAGKGGDIIISPGTTQATGGTMGNIFLGVSDGGTGPTRGANFVYIPIVAGTAGATPSTMPVNQVPLVFDTNNNRLWIYNSGWKSVTLS